MQFQPAHQCRQICGAGYQTPGNMRAETRPGDIRLWVEDNGIGIAPKQVRLRIFKMFNGYRPPPTRERAWAWPWSARRWNAWAARWGIGVHRKSAGAASSRCKLKGADLSVKPFPQAGGGGAGGGSHHKWGEHPIAGKATSGLFFSINSTDPLIPLTSALFGRRGHPNHDSSGLADKE